MVLHPLSRAHGSPCSVGSSVCTNPGKTSHSSVFTEITPTTPKQPPKKNHQQNPLKSKLTSEKDTKEQQGALQTCPCLQTVISLRQDHAVKCSRPRGQGRTTAQTTRLRKLLPARPPSVKKQHSPASSSRSFLGSKFHGDAASPQWPWQPRQPPPPDCLEQLRCPSPAPSPRHRAPSHHEVEHGQPTRDEATYGPRGSGHGCERAEG